MGVKAAHAHPKRRAINKQNETWQFRQVSRGQSKAARKGLMLGFCDAVGTKTVSCTHRISALLLGSRNTLGASLGISFKALTKLGVQPSQSLQTAAYNSGRTTQVPPGLAVNIGKQRISRKIGFNGKFLQYERA